MALEVERAAEVVRLVPVLDRVHVGVVAADHERLDDRSFAARSITSVSSAGGRSGSGLVREAVDRENGRAAPA
jgi:hypothetical protein